MRFYLTKNKAAFAALFSLFLAVPVSWPSFAHATAEEQPAGISIANSSVSHPFAVPPGLEDRVNFWKKIYSQYTTDQIVIHDMDNLDCIYEILHVDGLSPSTREQMTRRSRNKYDHILRKLAGGGQGNLSPDERRIKLMVKSGFSSAAQRIRGQLGQADRFRAGMERSGRYQGELNRIFREHGLPLELTALPHVESSFQIGAYSKVGAAGIWQFTQSTGRLFMKINYEVDERRDPFISAVAAAKLLKKNFENLGSWPLAVTAYNHGLNGMMRAKERHGANIVKIINNYKSPAFGFASRNFYSEFLAALHVSRNEGKYFPGLKKDPPLGFQTVSLNHYHNFKYLAEHYGVSRERLAELNPALRPNVLSGEKRVPKGYQLKVPAGGIRTAVASLAEVPDSEKHNDQKTSQWYKVERGDTLTRIAKRFNTSVSLLCQLNHLQSNRRVHIGQTLRLPQGSEVASDKETKPDPRGVKIATQEATPTPQPVVMAEHSPQPKAASAPKSDSATGESYTVRKNDHLFKIAKRHGITPQDLLQWNGLKQGGVIHPGQVLKVRKSEPSTNDTAPPASDDPKPAQEAVTSAEGASSGADQPVASPKAPDAPQALALSEVEVLKNHEKATLGAVTVETNETLGHYSEWAELSMSEIRKVNRMRHGHELKIGDKIKLVFSKVPPEIFKERRKEFHNGILEDFYTNYEIIRTEVISVKRGQSLWEICQGASGIPYWLLKAYNPAVDLTRLIPGQSLNIPIITGKDKKNPTT